MKISNDERFWRRVKKNDTCWLWLGAKNTLGYGTFTVTIDGIKRFLKAHRFALESSGISIPHGKIVMHKCDNPCCVNPSHLKIGTIADNNKDTTMKGRNRNGHNMGLPRKSGMFCSATTLLTRR